MNAQNVHNMHVQTWHMQYVCGDIVHCTYIVCVMYGKQLTQQWDTLCVCIMYGESPLQVQQV